MSSFNVSIDRLWVTLDSLNAYRRAGDINTTSIGTFILQVGETDVRGERFGVKTADKKIEMFTSDGKPTLFYGGEKFNGWGVDKNTTMKTLNVSGGLIDEVQFWTGTLENQYGGTVNNVYQEGGNSRGYNWGEIAEYTLTGGSLYNDQGYIETLYWSRHPNGVREGTIASGYDKIGKIIYIDAASAGADAGYIDEGYFDNGAVDAGSFDNGDWDAGDWQDAAPLGEEAMVW